MGLLPSYSTLRLRADEAKRGPCLLLTLEIKVMTRPRVFLFSFSSPLKLGHNEA